MTQTVGTCPVCRGVKRRDAYGVNYKHVMAGYDQISDTLPCDNCGGQYMWGNPSGQVPLRPDGTPCVHQYHGMTVGRCLTRFRCELCGDQHEIDSSD